MVFIRRSTGKKETGFTVAVALGKKKTVNGQIGIEIEVEGKKLPTNEIAATSGEPPVIWRVIPDGSLRGAENGEYVLSAPIMFEEVDSAVDRLWAEFRKKKSTFDKSDRTSVHIHMNVMPFFLNRLTSLMGLWFIFEEVLTSWCGEHRVGNLFCLRAKDAPAIVSQIRRYIRMDMQAPLKEHHHYANFNASAISKFGSVEIRCLRGTDDPQVIKQWVGILKRLYDASEEYWDPREVCTNLSGEGTNQFFDNILGPYASIVRAGTTMTDQEIVTSLYEGVRMAQDICYCRDWSVYNPMKLAPDPFGRDAKKIAKRLQGEEPVAVSIGSPNTLEAHLDEIMSEFEEINYDPEPDYDSFQGEI